MKARTVLVSGMDSGINPAAGLGVVRSLRAAGRDLRIIGVDYSAESSGLHSELLDDVVCLPSWQDVDVATWQAQMRARLTQGAVLIPCLDLECRLLAETMGGHPAILGPSRAALAWVAKPPLRTAERLGLASAPAEDRVADPVAVERFLRRSPDGAWVKGRYAGAYRVTTAAEVAAYGDHLTQVWGAPWHLEGHIPGQECAVGFCARDGQLLDAVLMTKAVLTPQGKTWSGEVAEVDGRLRDRLTGWVREAGWTGGGELELIRGWTGDLTLMEVNPRFPAWVHGVTACGANLPLSLVEGVTVRQGRPLTAGFTRVVEEIPVRDSLGVPPFAWEPAATPDAGKQTSIGRRQLLRAREPGPAAVPRAGDPAGLPSDPGSLETPLRWWLPEHFGDRVRRLRTALSPLREVTLALSIKTSPEPVLLRAAAAAGMVAEAISQDELACAREAGFAPGSAILNGPAKWWPVRAEMVCDAFFADSPGEFGLIDDLLDRGATIRARVAGLRIAPVGVDSRFGVRADDEAELATAAGLLAKLCTRLDAEWGLHFHLTANAVGTKRWVRECTAAFRVAEILGDHLGTAPAMVDFGGGWHADDLGELSAALRAVAQAVPAVLSGDAVGWVVEPGRLLSESAGAVVTRVLVRPRADDVVVDAGLGEVPEAPYRFHPISVFRDGSWLAVPPGTGRILGRTCMEADILATGVDTAALRPGDVLAVHGCGGYDSSMSYRFGRGAP